MFLARLETLAVNTATDVYNNIAGHAINKAVFLLSVMTADIVSIGKSFTISELYNGLGMSTMTTEQLILMIIYTIILPKSFCLYVCLYVGLRKLHPAVLVRSSREISQTVRITCHSFLSCGRILVRPSNNYCLILGKNQKRAPKPSHRASVQLISTTRRNGDNLNRDKYGELIVDRQQHVATAIT